MFKLVWYFKFTGVQIKTVIMIKYSNEFKQENPWYYSVQKLFS